MSTAGNCVGGHRRRRAVFGTELAAGGAKERPRKDAKTHRRKQKTPAARAARQVGSRLFTRRVGYDGTRARTNRPVLGRGECRGRASGNGENRNTEWRDHFFFGGPKGDTDQKNQENERKGPRRKYMLWEGADQKRRTRNVGL